MKSSETMEKDGRDLFGGLSTKHAAVKPCELLQYSSGGRAHTIYMAAMWIPPSGSGGFMMATL